MLSHIAGLRRQLQLENDLRWLPQVDRAVPNLEVQIVSLRIAEELIGYPMITATPSGPNL